MNPLHVSVQQIICDRKTEKVLGNPDAPVRYSDEQLESGDKFVKQAIRDCGWAPFHYDRQQDGLAEPWRVYWLSCSDCQRLAQSLPDLIPDLTPGNKMPGLLSGCGSLTLFTWLPQPVADDAEPATQKKATRVNLEHLSATSAAVQNFLLLLTAGELKSYWASGTLIADYLFETLGVPDKEMLAAAVFVHYPGADGEFQVVSGKQRVRRSDNHQWFKSIKFTG